jgi:D-psicose/D-tagatose/L-ribulose 3-epimerase
MKLSLCNEVLRDLPFAQQCALAAALGCRAGSGALHAGRRPGRWTSARRQLRQATAAQGLAISSLHWLLVRRRPVARHARRRAAQRTLALLQRLIGFAAACGAQVLVHGSPAQRSPGRARAWPMPRRAEDAWPRWRRWRTAAGVVYCIEPLSPAETPVVNTVAQAAAVVDASARPRCAPCST